ncbi:MAG TPA: hypothetical protein VJP80_06995 [Candidatus Saccharimonadales bacterium]|nr:hypothetical protein [Candidatus Saccharimonadales bacterium]
MPHNALLLAAIAAPLVVMVLLRINAAMVFLSLCLGEVLVQYVASQANDLLHFVAPHASKVSTTTMQLMLLLAPAVVTALVTVLSVRGRLKTLVNILPATAASLLAVLLAAPILPGGFKHSLHSETAWHYIANSQALVVGAGAAISLAFLWTQRRLFRLRDDKRHK